MGYIKDESGNIIGSVESFGQWKRICDKNGITKGLYFKQSDSVFDVTGMFVGKGIEQFIELLNE